MFATSTEGFCLHYDESLLLPALLTMSFSAAIINFMNRNREQLPAYIGITLGMGIGGLLCVGLNKAINARVLETCDRNLNQIIYIKTAVGDSYGCVSRMVLNGPPAPIKP